MLHTGVVRNLDDLGRIVIPMELRRTMGYGLRQPVAVLVDGEDIVLRRYADSCALCGETDGEFEEVRGRAVCSQCASEVRSL
jgi:AbrB family transcriptional regulator, transcriptional pleiotropic regulator of transition state genes